MVYLVFHRLVLQYPGLLYERKIKNSLLLRTLGIVENIILLRTLGIAENIILLRTLGIVESII